MKYGDVSTGDLLQRLYSNFIQQIDLASLTQVYSLKVVFTPCEANHHY